MTVLFPTYLTAVETAGVAVLRVTWSDKLRQRLATMTADRLSVRVLREAFEGLPIRIAQGLAGEQVFSGAGVGVRHGWYRQRLDTVAAGAPGNFVPGVCVAGPVGGQAVDLDYVPGSARLPADAAVPEDLTARVRLAQGDVAVLDSRCARRWSHPEQVFRLSVVRPWLEPERDGRELVGSDILPRVQRFAGVPWAPATTLEQWLFERHERRNDDA